MKPRSPRTRSALLALLLAFAAVVPAGLAGADTTSATVTPTDTTSATVTPADTSVPTDTSTPTDTSVPTDTSTPTDTSVPTDTSTPTDTPTPTDTSTPTDTGSAPGSPPPSSQPPTGTPHQPRPHPHKGSGGFHVPGLPGGAPKRPHPHKPITTVHHLTLMPRPHPHVKPWPVTLTIKTVPNLANVAFNFDGRWVTTDQYGVATVTEEHNLASHTLRIGDLGQEDTGLKFRFTRWVGQRDPSQQLMSTVTGLPMRADATIYAAISVQYPVTPQVLTQTGAQVLDSDVSSITVRDSNGRLSVLMPGQQSWLDGVVPSFQKNVLNPQLVGYSVQAVVVHGTNAADAGRQHFDVTKSSFPSFTALFYNLTITGQDSLFGWALGNQATVRYPDGTTLTVDLGRQHRAMVANLPRGKYEVTLAAAASIVSASKVQLSRTMAFEARAVTALDLLTVLVSAILLAVLLLVLGRTDWAHRLLARIQPGRWYPRGRWAWQGRPARRAGPDSGAPLPKPLQ